MANLLCRSLCRKTPMHLVLSAAVNLHYKTNKNAISFIVFRQQCYVRNAWINLKPYMKTITSIFSHLSAPVVFITLAQKYYLVVCNTAGETTPTDLSVPYM